MATRKSVSKSTALVPWEQEMADAASKQASKEKASGISKAISTRGGVLSIDDNPVEDNELRVIVLAAVHENQYFKGAFDPKTPQAPVCYSFSDPLAHEPEDGMKPHEKSAEPQGDGNGQCANCWANEFGSADIGKGKACKNVRRLAVITEDALTDVDELNNAQVRMLKVPVMSVKNWANYVRQKLGEDIKRPCWGVVTTIRLVLDPTSQFKVQFGFEELIQFDQALYTAMQKKVAEVQEQLVAPYPDYSEEEVKPQRSGRAQPMKPTGRAVPAMKRSMAVRGKAQKF